MNTPQTPLQPKTQPRTVEYFAQIVLARCRGLIGPIAFATVLPFWSMSTATFGLTPFGNGVAKIATGYTHTCVTNRNAGAQCFGSNVYGELGDNTQVERRTPVDVQGLASGVIDIVAGDGHTCAIVTGGAVKCWGNNSYGQLGDSTRFSRRTPVDVIGLSSGVTAIAAGRYHTCARTNTGALKCWGLNDTGQLGDGSTTNRAVPTDVAGLSSGVSAVTAGLAHTCARVSATGNVVRCWGSNTNGQLGDGTTTQRLTPVDVSGGIALVPATIDAGSSHTCMINTSGAMKCWGDNFFGQLGDGTTTQRLTPVDVSGLTGSVFRISAGSFNSCAVTTAGVAKCWGYNRYDTLGDGSSPSLIRSIPADVPNLGTVNSIAVGFGHACALSSRGLMCWGFNASGQVGSNAPSQRNSPVYVTGLSSGMASAGAGGLHSCALTSAGGVKCWGNGNGILGNGTFDASASPVDVTGLASGVSAIATGGFHNCALLTGGGVKCWGGNYAGQLGNGTTNASSVPVSVSGLASGVIAIAAGDAHTCAVTSSGGVKCWGDNLTGQLGDNSTTQRLVPTDVSGLTSGVAAIATGLAHTCALTSAGGAKCWGQNNYGQLGDNSTTQRLIPIDVFGLTTGVASITTGERQSCAALATGGAKCWGYNAYGQLGNNSTVASSVPVSVVGLSQVLTKISLGDRHTCALTNAGGAKCWGNSFYGQLGDGGINGRALTPIDVVGLSSGVTALSAGKFHSCAVIAGGTKCWGDSSSGQVGDGTVGTVAAPALVLTAGRDFADVNADGSSDLLFVNSSTGELSATLFNGASAISPVSILPAGSGWTVTHAADVDGDLKADLILRNADGRAAMLTMNGTSPASFFPVLSAGTGWTVTHAADLNGDGKADLIIKNVDGRVAVLIVGAGGSVTYVALTAPGSIYTPTHVGDFNNDGKADIVLKGSDGSAVILLMNGATVTSSSFLLNPGGPWSVTHVADLNGDNASDVIIRNTDGSVAMLLMSGTTVTSAAFLLTAGSPYTVTHTGDFNGDGKADIIIRAADGATALLQMNGTVVTAATFLLLGGSTTTVAQVADYNADGKSDILLRNADGSTTAILMNGGVVTAAVSVWGPGTLVAVP